MQPVSPVAPPRPAPPPTVDELEHALIRAIADGDTNRMLALGHHLDQLDNQRQARLSASDSLHAAARWYGVNGIPVFPLKPGRKHPITEHGLNDATTELTQIDAWWTKWPTANIGGCTGHAFDVVDIDGSKGWHSLLEHNVLNKYGAPVIGQVSTPRPGGRHVMTQPRGRRNGAAIVPGVDVRGKGGYVVLPPSHLAGDGDDHKGTYVWIQPLEVK